MPEWLSNQAGLFKWLGLASLVMVAASVVLTPFIIARLPPDYLARSASQSGERDRGRAVRVARNVGGVVLIGLGLVMLVMPGQGLVTVLLGVVVMDFRGKHRVVQWLLSRPKVLSSMNWIRRKANKKPLEKPPQRPEAEAKRRAA